MSVVSFIASDLVNSLPDMSRDGVACLQFDLVTPLRGASVGAARLLPAGS